MSTPILMPRFGMTQEDATIVRWLCPEGTKVERGDPVCEVTTDKINMEVEAPADGVLGSIQHQEGETVPVQQLIAYILSEAETEQGQPAAEAAQLPPASVSQGEKPVAVSAEAGLVTAATGNLPAAATPLAQRMAAVEGLQIHDIMGSGTGGKITSEDVRRALQQKQGPVIGQPASSPTTISGKVSASPAARHLARTYAIDLQQVHGTGLEGRVQGWDVTAYHQQQQELPKTPKPDVVKPDVALESPEPGQGVKIIPLEGMRRTIADRLQDSYQQAPHIFISMDIDMGRAMALREALNPRMPSGRAPISMTAMIVRACALALRDQPLLNSHFQDEKIYCFSDVHIGVAVALETGLIVPVIHQADRLSLNALGDSVADLSRRAREGKLRPDDVTGGTFTISNLGMFDVDQFTAILNPPQVGILAVGRVARRFVPDANDQPVVRSLMTVSLSADHRAIDGLVGARFLTALRGRLENPNLLLE